jgi:hypothetical protein
MSDDKVALVPEQRHTGDETHRYKKAYLGDGVYAQYDGYTVTLTTENGVDETNVIFLEPNVVESLLKYLKDGKAIPDRDKWGNPL